MRPTSLWLVKGLGPGGAEHLLLSHARISAEAGRPTEIGFVRHDRAHLVPAFTATGTEVHSLGRGGARFVAYVRLAGLLARRRGRTVHVHSPSLAPLVRIVAVLTRSKVVYTEHNRWAQYRLPTRLLNALTYPLDDHRIFVSDGVQQSTWWNRGCPSEVLHHGIELVGAPSTLERAAVRRELGIGDEQTLVMTVANLRTEKAPIDLLRAAEQAVRANPQMRFVWVGQGPLEAEFVAEIARRQLGEHVQFVGYRPDARRLLAAADIFCLSSHHEGLPVAIMEALDAGVPVVATAVGGLGEAVGGADPCGDLVAPNRPDELAAALVALAADDERRQKYAASARSRAARFDARRAVARIESIYAGLR